MLGCEVKIIRSDRDSMRMSSPKVTFLILVNSKSGGQDGLQLLEKFLQIFQEVKYENLSFQINVK